MILEDICKSVDKPVYIYTVARMPKIFGYGYWKVQKELN